MLDIIDKHYHYQEKYYDAILSFVFTFDEKFNDIDIPFLKKAEMITKLLYWCESKFDINGHEYSGNPMGTFYYASDRGNEYEREFIKQNFYNLSEFEQYWEVGKRTFK